MRQISSRITERGQATIPAEVRRLLGLVPHDRIVFEIEGDDVRVRRATSAVSRTAGALRTDIAGRGVTELRAAAETAFARETITRARG
jgi:AbrB family looped-hinge helix DNA binding protein